MKLLPRRPNDVAFLVVFSLLVSLAIASYVMSDRFAASEDSVIHTQVVIALLRGVAAEVSAAESAQRGYALTGDRTLLIDYDVGLDAIPRHLKLLQQMTADNPKQQQLLSQMEPLADQMLAMLRQSVQLQDQDPTAKDQQAVLTSNGSVLSSKILALLSEMQSEETHLGGQRTIISSAKHHRSLIILTFGFLLASVMAVVLFLLMSSEVTRRTQAESEANENEERLRLLVNGLRDHAIMRLDLDGRINTWSLGGERLFGYRVSEILGEPLARLFRSSDQEIPEEQLRTAFRDGHFHNECQQLRKDGKLFWATTDITLLRNDAGQASGYALIIRDISERRQQQDEIRQREAQLDAFFSNAPVGLAIIDKNLRFQRINGPFSQFNGLPAQDNLGKQVQEVVRHLALQIEPIIREVANSGEPVIDFEITGPLPATPATMGWWLESFFPISRDEQVVTQIGIVAQDISALKQAENRVRGLSARILQLRDDERRRLARDLHDSLGQNLTAVKMNTSFLARDAASMDERRRNALTESIELIDRCLQEVRTISHLLHPPMLDEVGLVPAIRWFATGFAQRSGIEVELDLPGKLRRLPTDVETAVFRVIQESLTNVHRHSGSPTAVIRLKVDPEHIHLQVIDHGRGIPPHKLSLHQESETIGVGLMGMRERLRQLGGQLNITSDGGGTVIRVIVPLGEPASARSA